MTVALETSKRKFHALLDNLTTGPLPDLTAASSHSTSTNLSPSHGAAAATLAADTSSLRSGNTTATADDSPAAKRSRLGIDNGITNTTTTTTTNPTNNTTTLRAVSTSSTLNTTSIAPARLPVTRSSGISLGVTSNLIRQARLRGQAQAKALGHRVASAASTSSGRSTTTTTTTTYHQQHQHHSEPNYTPWSHTAFLTRLRTFADLRRWTSKPEAVNEVAWAKRGWVCDDDGESLNTVACRGGCEARVVVALRPPRRDAVTGEEIVGSEDFSVEVEDGVVQRFQALIAEGHTEECLWRNGGCKEDVYRLPMARPGIWRPQLRQRYASFVSSSSSSSSSRNSQRLLLPADKVLERPDWEGEGKLLDALGDGFFDTTDVTSAAETEALDTSTHPTGTTESQAKTSINTAAFAFALYGWHGVEEGSGNAMATCEACFRRIGLWLYASAPRSLDTTVNGSGTQQSHQKGNDNHETDNNNEEERGGGGGEAEEDTTLMKLNLITNHRDYCPWVNAASQSMPGTFAGLASWEILRRVVANSALRRGEQEEGGAAESAIAGEGNRQSGELSYGDDVVGGGGGGGVEHMSGPSDADKADRDRVRFARLKELTKAMSFKGLRRKGVK